MRGLSDPRMAAGVELVSPRARLGHSYRRLVPEFAASGKTLGRTLRRAADPGIAKALVTCAKTNAASVRIILHNGGVRDAEGYLLERTEVVQRYWISL
jgi:hypothetical protein